MSTAPKPAPVPPQKPLAQRTVIILCLAGGALLGLAFLDDCVASRNNRPSILNQIERAFR